MTGCAECQLAWPPTLAVGDIRARLVAVWWYAQSHLLGEAVLDGVAGQFHAVVQLELAQRGLHVIFHSPVADHQRVGDLPGGAPRGHLAEYLGLPLGERRHIRWRLLGHPAVLAEH